MKVFGLNYEREVRIGEHTYMRPPAPKNKEDIWFINDTKENAFWRRDINYPAIWYSFIPYETLIDTELTTYNDDGTIKTLNVEDSNIIRKIYAQEIERRTKGIHFRNGDDIEYLTGSNYFTLQWCKMFGNSKNDGYGSFFKFQRDIFYLLDYMWLDWILGVDLSKAKKIGITQVIDGGYNVDKATSMPEWTIGFMSRSENVAVETNMKLFLYAFDNLPLALKPKVGYKAAKGGNIEFTESSKGKLANRKSSTSHVLNTKVFCVPTAEHSFDSFFMNIIRLDEFPKYFQDSSKEPKEILRNNKATVKDQDFFRGRIIITSYPPEEDDKGSTQAADIFNQSKLSTMRFGKTESELICYHIPAYKSIKSCIDKYGDCDEIKAMNIIMQNRERVKKDKKAYLAEVRQNPNDEIEAFGGAGKSTTFDIIHLAQCEFDLRKELTDAPMPPYVEGNLEWDVTLWEIGKQNKRPPGVFSKVIFVPITEKEKLQGKEGRWKMYHDIPERDKNAVLLLGRDDAGNLLYPELFKTFGGIDPTQYADGDDVDEPSMQASYTMNLYDSRQDTFAKKPVTKVIVSEYCCRTEIAEMAYQDMVKEIIYFGKLVAVEANSPMTYTRLKHEGLGNFLIVKHKEGYFTRWNISLEEDEYTGIKRTRNATQNDLLEMLIELIKHYTFKPKDGEMGYASTIKSLKLFRKLMDFDPLDTKTSDEVMAIGYTLLAYETYIIEQSRPSDNQWIDSSVQALFSAFAT